MLQQLLGICYTKSELMRGMMRGGGAGLAKQLRYAVAFIRCVSLRSGRRQREAAMLLRQISIDFSVPNVCASRLDEASLGHSPLP